MLENHFLEEKEGKEDICSPKDDRILYTYRYVFRTSDMEENRLGVRILTDTLQGHAAFCEQISKDESVVSCIREYVGEYDLSLCGYVENIKKEVVVDETV